MNNEEQRQLLEHQKRALYFHKEKVDVHVKMKSNYFYNGTISEISEADFFILIDFKVGEIPIFFIDIERIERYVKK